MIIDFHSHCFPDSLAPRALATLKHNAGDVEDFPCTDGTCSGTEKHMDKYDIDRAVICNIATNARQQQNVNNFAIQIAKTSQKLIPLGSLHPDGENKELEIQRLVENGIRGIKIHPDYVSVEINSPKYDEIFVLCEHYGIFVVTHAGYDPVSPNHIHAAPYMILDVVRRYKKLKLIAAHMGGFGCSKQVLNELVGNNIWFDTSLSSRRPDEKNDLIKILKYHSPERILFGTDTPWSFPDKELEIIYSSGLNSSTIDNILSQNAMQLLYT